MGNNKNEYNGSIMANELPLPPFSIKDLRDAVPSHLFQRSVVISSLYLVVDLLIIGMFFYVATYFTYAPVWLQMILWPIYWVLQGCVMTGVWVIAHECGHQSFSQWKIVNNTVGLIFHSLLLVPYHSWRISHGMHHKGTSHMDRDQVFVPALRSKLLERYGLKDISELVQDTPLGYFIGIIMMGLVGWPGYLIFNASGQDYKQRANHFEPDSPIFKKGQSTDVILSDIGLAIVGCILFYFSWIFSFGTVVKYYFIPYLWVNFWLVTITYLQHTHSKIPHYRGDEWTFIRGALATVDRDYGILNHIFHHITDTHVCHHLFSTMPHYNAVEATKHLKKVLGSYYNYDSTPVLKALWDSWSTCHYVDDEGDIILYKTKGVVKTD